jgi:hypothetical protein
MSSKIREDNANSVILACIRRFREQPPAPKQERNPLPFRREDFYWKNTETLHEPESDTSPSESLEKGFDGFSGLGQSLTVRSASPSDSLSSFHSDGAADLDRYASSLLAKCDSLMREYEQRNSARFQKKKENSVMEFRKLEEKESANDLHSPRKDTSFEVSTVTAKSALNIPQLSVDSIFPLYNSSSDDASMMGVLNERKRERLLPLSESEVVPFLSDEVIAMMWSRLVLVRMEINSCT